jgi:RNA polymerase sigma-70 factor (ECF subfamily)
VSALESAELRRALSDMAGPLLAYFERRVTPAADAADLVAETMLQAWRRASDFPVGAAARQRMWLFTIGANVLANHRRSDRRRRKLAERLRLHLGGTARAATDQVEYIALRDAVYNLKKEHRELVMLIHWDGLSLAEAAELLQVNASTARSRYAAALESLRFSLGDELTGASALGPEQRAVRAESPENSLSVGRAVREAPE